MLLRKLRASAFTIIAFAVILYFQLGSLTFGDDYFPERWKRKAVIEWDVREYYQYLPATFIMHDVSMQYMDTLPKPAFNSWWVGKLPNGKWMGRLTMGMAIMYSPFFLVSDLAARAGQYPRDGFSIPYQLGIFLVGFVYGLIGLFVLSLCLRRFFSDLITAVTIVCIAIGTNLYYYSTVEGAMPHATLFCLSALFLYFTMRWHTRAKAGYIIGLGIVYSLACLIRPTNGLMALVFIFYGVYNRETLQAKWLLIKTHYLQLLLIIPAIILAALPQMLYWHQQSGQWIYYSYSGERFFFDHPRIWKGLFSFRKGWFIYTPMMLFAMAGFFFMRDKLKTIRPAIFIFMVLNIWTVLSWWCWWYGGSFGLRAFIESYTFLAFPMAAFWQWAFKKGWLLSMPLLIIAGFFIELNMFQSMQVRKGVMHWDSMTAAMYKAIFMREKKPENADKLLSPPDYDAARKGLPEDQPAPK